MTIRGLHQPSRAGGRLLRALLTALLMFMGGIVHAAPQQLGNRAYKASDLLRASAVLRDPGTQLSLEEVRRLDAQGQFVPLTQLFGAGYARGAFWMRLELQAADDTPIDWWLHLNPAYLDDVRMFHVPPDGLVLPAQLSGDRMSDPNPVHRSPTFSLRMAPGLHTIYLRVQSTSSISMLPSLVPMQLAATVWQREYMMLGLYTGLEAALLVASVLGALMLRRRVYVYFALFIAAGALQRFTLSGLAEQWLLPENALLADGISSSLVGLAAAAGSFFFAELFQYRRHHPRLYWIILVSAFYMMLTALSPIWGLFQHMAAGAAVLMVVNVLLMVVPLRRHWRTSSAAVRFGVVGFVLYAGLVLLNMLSLLGLIPPSPEMLRAAQPGSLVLLFMLLQVILLQTTRAQRDRQAAEQTAQAARAAEERERLAREEQSHLTALIAHEIRTPVAVIDAALQSLQVLDENPTPERMLRHERIGRAIQRMNTLMELALTQDRLEISTWTHRLSSVNLVDMTQEVLAGMGPTAKERVSVTSAPGTCVVQADDRMLHFALINLIDNALKYSPRGAQVEVSIGPMEQGGVPGCSWCIDDRGPGISEVDRERVFQKYFRAAETTSSPGLGLGLHIVRQIISRHHGEVVALPTPSGLGTRFACWLPIEPKESEP